MRTRIEIETIALRWSLEKGGVEWEANLLSAFHRLSRQSKIDTGQSRRHQRSLEQGACGFPQPRWCPPAGRPPYLSIRSRLFEQAERYVALSIMSSGPLRDDVTEHKQLMRAALNRELDKTLELNRAAHHPDAGQSGRHRLRPAKRQRTCATMNRKTLK